MEPNLVLDVGMYNGDDTAYYLNKGYRVVAVEADPGFAAKASERFRVEIGTGRLTVLNVAVSDTASQLPFWICESNPEWSSFFETLAGRNGAPHHRVDVQGRRFSEILEVYGVPYYLKIDIEGSDLLCVESLRPGAVPAYLSIELSPAVRAKLPLFRDLGFTSFKCVSQFHYLPVQMPPSTEEQIYGK